MTSSNYPIDNTLHKSDTHAYIAYQGLLPKIPYKKKPLARAGTRNFTKAVSYAIKSVKKSA